MVAADKVVRSTACLLGGVGVKVTATRFSRKRPLWEARVAEGLAVGNENGVRVGQAVGVA